MPAKVLKVLKGRAMPGEVDGVAARGRDLREWFRAFVTARRGRDSGPKTFANWGR